MVFLTRVLRVTSILLLFYIVNSIYSVIVNIKERINEINKNKLVEKLSNLFYSFRREMNGFCEHS